MKVELIPQDPLKVLFALGDECHTKHTNFANTQVEIIIWIGNKSNVGAMFECEVEVIWDEKKEEVWLETKKWYV